MEEAFRNGIISAVAFAAPIAGEGIFGEQGRRQFVQEVWLSFAVRNHGTPASQWVDPSPDIIAREHYADGYVGGVIDAT